MNHYEQLGLDRNATQQQIKSAYRKLAVKYHPDRNQGDMGAQERFKGITLAYQTLGDPQKRMEYDRQLDSGHGRGGFAGNADFFSEMYNSMFGKNPFNSQFQQFHVKKKPSLDINFTVQVSLDQAYAGCSKNISYIYQQNCKGCNGTGYNPESKFIMCQDCRGTGYVSSQMTDEFGRILVSRHTCQKCNGSGHRHQDTCRMCEGKRTVKTTKTMQIQVPKGAFTQMVITHKGLGKRDSATGRVGNLNILLNVSQVSRDGNFRVIPGTSDIQTQITVTYYDILTRADKTHTITLPDGTSVDFKIPQRFQMDKLIRIKGKGMPISPQIASLANGTGDLLVRVLLQIPEQIPPKAIQVLQKFQGILRQNR